MNVLGSVVCHKKSWPAICHKYGIVPAQQDLFALFASELHVMSPQLQAWTPTAISSTSLRALAKEPNFNRFSSKTFSKLPSSRISHQSHSPLAPRVRCSEVLQELQTGFTETLQIYTYRHRRRESPKYA